MFRPALACILFTLPLAAQQPQPIEHPAPTYPPIARAAHVSGTVVLEATLDATGKVTNLKNVSGPPMLLGAAKEAVLKWRYAPGTTSPIKVTVPFDLPAPHNPDDEKIAREYFPLSEDCHKQTNSGTDTAATATVCVHAAEVAATFSDQERFIERRGAYVWAAGALLRDKRPQEALAYAEKAVAVIRQGHDDGSGSNAVYATRAQAEAALGNLPAADADMTTAEVFERSAIEKLGKGDPTFVQRAYVPVLKQQLQFHARLLTALGKPTESAAKQAEADKL